MANLDPETVLGMDVLSRARDGEGNLMLAHPQDPGWSVLPADGSVAFKRNQQVVDELYAGQEAGNNWSRFNDWRNQITGNTD